MATPARPRLAEEPWSPSTGPALLTLLVAGALARGLWRAEAGPAGWALGGLALIPVHALALTLGRYYRTQGPCLADCRAQGGVPWGAMGRELTLLWLLQAFASAALLAQLAAGAAILAPALGANLRLALPGAALGLLILPALDLARAIVRHKLERFYRFDGVILVAPEPEGAGRLARLDRWLDVHLYPPALAAPPAVIEFLQAAHPLPAGLCPVCGDALGEAARVACTRCRAPHHRDCFEFSQRCARYGCGGTDCEAISAASISVAEE